MNWSFDIGNCSLKFPSDYPKTVFLTLLHKPPLLKYFSKSVITTGACRRNVAGAQQ